MTAPHSQGTPIDRRQQILDLLTGRPGLRPRTIEGALGAETWPELLEMLRLGVVRRDPDDRYFLAEKARG